MKLEWNSRPYLFTSKIGEEELDGHLSQFESMLTDEQSIELITVSTEMESEIQCSVSTHSSIVFLKPESLESYTKMMKDLKLIFTFEEVDWDLFLGNFNLVDPTPEFLSLMEQYINKVFTVNDVLDKINLKGIESLNESDKLILKNISS
jgi:hypothetical protein